ncbi:MAG TPA: ABC transporter permease subunit, partial [Stellaceae bacterium]|nr:ABC transporter permease subunit [Stellaceae bacterium]
MVTTDPSRVQVASAHRVALWRDMRVRGIAAQVLTVGTIAGLAIYLGHNAIVNLEQRGIATGFAFLKREAAFEISSTLIEYSPASSYGRALLVGILNTLLVSSLGIVLTTIVGTLLGIARLSTNWLVQRVTGWYIEIMRNTPLLLQLIVWWDLLRVSAPLPREAFNPLPGVFISNRGLNIPVPAWDPAYLWMLLALVVGAIATALLGRQMHHRQELTGKQFPIFWAGVGLILGPPLLVFLIAGAPVELDVPVLQGFNFVGGENVTPEFAALLFGLVAYTSAFVAEIVRSGILSVSKGQTEAASALGLRPSWTLRLVVLPQAVRVIVPPMTSEYLSLTKNSSLAVYIGFPDFVSIANTEANQTGQVVEVIAILMAVYLTI